MNQIFWGKDRISILTDHLVASEHQHCMLQIFLSYQERLSIQISGKNIIGQLIIVNTNVPHAFSTENKLHYSSLIEPASSFAIYLRGIMAKKDYLVINDVDHEQLHQLLKTLIASNKLSSNYKLFLRQLHKTLGYQHQPLVLDDRVTECLTLIETCPCIDGHSIKFFAESVALSTSRLSHLFSNQVGIPLKSFILLHQMKQSLLALLEGKTITEVSINAGFDSPSHFASTIKKMTGLTASTTKKMLNFILYE